MLKECDKDVKRQQSIDRLPITLIPNKYLQTESVFLCATADKQFMNEVKYSIQKKLMERTDIYLIRFLQSVKYLGIIYPSGRIVFKKIRKVRQSKSEPIVNFHCVMNRMTNQEQKKLDRWEKLINKEDFPIVVCRKSGQLRGESN